MLLGADSVFLMQLGRKNGRITFCVWNLVELCCVDFRPIPDGVVQAQNMQLHGLLAICLIVIMGMWIQHFHFHCKEFTLDNSIYVVAVDISRMSLGRFPGHSALIICTSDRQLCIFSPIVERKSIISFTGLWHLTNTSREPSETTSVSQK